MNGAKSILCAFAFLVLASLTTGCKDQKSSSANPDSNPSQVAASAADQKATQLLRQAYVFIEQKKADEAEKALAQVLEMKPQLSKDLKEQLTAAIIGLGMLDPARGLKLGKINGPK